jgi:hypothetical protein
MDDPEVDSQAVDTIAEAVSERLKGELENDLEFSLKDVRLVYEAGLDGKISKADAMEDISDSCKDKIINNAVNSYNNNNRDEEDAYGTIGEVLYEPHPKKNDVESVEKDLEQLKESKNAQMRRKNSWAVLCLSLLAGIWVFILAPWAVEKTQGLVPSDVPFNGIIMQAVAVTATGVIVWFWVGYFFELGKFTPWFGRYFDKIDEAIEKDKKKSMAFQALITLVILILGLVILMINYL